MLEHCTIKTIDGITEIHFSKAPTIGDARDVIDRLADENSYHLRLWDFSDVLFDFTMDEIREIAAYGKTKFPEPNRMALAAPQDLAYGTLRAFEVYREEERHSIPKVFRTKPEAMEWLVVQQSLLKPAAGNPGNE